MAVNRVIRQPQFGIHPTWEKILNRTYTRVCERCDNHYKTSAKFGRVCDKCNKSINGQGKNRKGKPRYYYLFMRPKKHHSRHKNNYSKVTINKP